MTPLAVIAHTPAGFAASDPWSPTIDGILAYELVRERLGEDFAVAASDDAPMQPVEGLPLAVERHGDWWWYMCSAPVYAAATQARRYYHRRFDMAAAETYLDRSKARIPVAAGPYKNARLSHLVTVCPTVTWHVIGDRAGIERLLRRVHYIGRGVATGMGRVTRWEIAAGDEGIARFHRPLPVSYAAEHGISGRVMEWGIRPPARIAANRAVCAMPVVR